MTGYTMAELQRDYGARWIIDYRGADGGFRGAHRTAWPVVSFTGKTAAGLAGQLKMWEDRQRRYQRGQVPDSGRAGPGASDQSGPD
jgi:hypothetical protein